MTVAQPLLAVLGKGSEPVPHPGRQTSLMVLENWPIVDAGRCVTRGEGSTAIPI